MLVELQAMELDPNNQNYYGDAGEDGIEYGYDHIEQEDQSQGQKKESS